MHGSDSLVLSLGLTKGKRLCDEREEKQMQQGAPWSSEEVYPGSECAQILEDQLRWVSPWARKSAAEESTPQQYCVCVSFSKHKFAAQAV